ncbi:MAG: YqgE/AlgH family protein [Saprospiraceae bacterium]|nr:YqgE/AlgH family protein [Saprospiraceae bacterium]
MGYSGWSEGHLEEEMKETSWLVDDMDANYLLESNHLSARHLSFS